MESALVETPRIGDDPPLTALRDTSRGGEPSMASDIEIAQQARLERITTVAAKLGIPEEHLEPYGHTKAKISLSI